MDAPVTASQPRPISRQVLAPAQMGTCAVAQSALPRHSTGIAKPASASSAVGGLLGIAPLGGFVQPLAQAEPQRQATRPGLMVRCTFLRAGAWRPTVGAGLTRTLRVTGTCDVTTGRQDRIAALRVRQGRHIIHEVIDAHLCYLQFSSLWLSHCWPASFGKQENALVGPS